MRRGLAAVLFASLASCSAIDEGGDVHPARSEVLPMGSAVLVALPDGTIVVEDDGRLLQYDPRAADAEPTVVGPATDIGEVHAAVPMDGAILVLASGGTFILREDAWIPSPLADALDGPIVDALLLPSPTGRGQGDLWIATASSLYRVVDGVAERLTLDESLADAQLAPARRPEGPALWVRLADRVLEIWRDRSGVIRTAALILEGAPDAIGGDADGNGWVVLGGRLHSIGADRRLVDRGVEVARLLTSPLSHEVWVIDAAGASWLHADGTLFHAPDVTVDPTQVLAVAADGSLYASGASIVRYAPRRYARVRGAPDGSLLVTPQTFDIEVEGSPTIEATIDGQLPERGRIGIFNRSHYEEVLVVRVHPEYLAGQRIPHAPELETLFEERYESIRDFEKHLARNGTVVLKLFLNVGRDEQRDRFVDRIDEPEANWKFNPGDIAERRLWDQYMDSYERALNATSRPWAPWYAVPADDKAYMRRVVADLFRRTLEQIDPKFPDVDAEARAEMLALREELTQS